MALINKPDYSEIWASGGSVVEPSDVKKQTGWTAEVPPYQWENWIQNRQDQMLAHINQRGIPQWDGQTEYEAGGLSYVQGADGVVYKSVAASGPSSVSQDPTTDVADAYWTVAFASSQLATEVAAGIAEIATQAEAVAGVNDQNFMTPLKTAQAIVAQRGLPFGYFSGFVMANDGVSPNTTISVAPGAARNTTNSVDIVLTATLRGILQSSGSWTAGDNQNKLDTGARANNTWYHVFAIRKTSDGTVDILFSLSATAPTMPTGYAGFRRIGSIMTDGSGNILGFLNFGRKFYWKALVRDISVAGGSSGESTVSLRTPSGISVLAHCDVHVRGDNNAIYLRPIDTDTVSIAGPQTSAWIAGTGIDVTSVTLEAGSGRVSVISQNSQVILQVNTGGYGVTTIYWEEL